MLNKGELRERNIQFWSEFKEYMRPAISSNGKRINWLSYPTSVKFLYLRMECDKVSARLNFDIQAKDPAIREIVWEQMEELKKVLTDAMGGDSGEWIFAHYSDDIESFCRITWELKGVNFFVEADHPVIYKFLKEKIIAFDEFYQNYKDILIGLIK